MRVGARVVLLVALWLLAWGQLTLANVLSGAAVATVLLLAFPPFPRRSSQRHRLSLVGALRLAGYVVLQLVTSNVVMAREVVRRTPRARPGVIAHELEAPSEEVVTLMTSVITLSPGTMAVDVDHGSSTIYVHVLFLSDVDDARASLRHLERLAAATIRTSASVRTAEEAAP